MTNRLTCQNIQSYLHVVVCCAVYSVGRTDWRVFYHFVGAVPGSTDLFSMLKRLLLEMEVVSVSKSYCSMNVK